MSSNSGSVIYREVQQSRQVWIWLFIGLMAGFAWYGFLQQIIFGKPFGNNPEPMPDIEMWIFWIVLGVASPLSLYFQKLIIEVRRGEIHIRFFPFYFYSRIIPLEKLKFCEVRQYRSIWGYGSWWRIAWGIGWTPRKGWLYNVSGDGGGVQLELSDGKRLLIGSRSPEMLALAIKEAMS
jgi:hypothetical protein